MDKIKLFFKGIGIGIGGIAPGLSGSVLMVIFGLYKKVINAIATLFKDFKKNMIFLLPIGIGMVIGVIGFSRLISYTIDNYEIQTRLAFLGLLVGTIPLFFSEIKSENKIERNHYMLMGISFLIGLIFLTFSTPNASSSDLNIFQSFLLGFIGISATIIPGVDSAAILSAFGLYGNWLDLTSLNNITLEVYLPAGLGVIAGVFILSALINKLLKKWQAATFSILFGFFVSIVPCVLKSESGAFITLGNNVSTYLGIIFFIMGIGMSLLFNKLKRD